MLSIEAASMRGEQDRLLCKIISIEKATPGPVDQAIDMLRLTSRASEMFLELTRAIKRLSYYEALVIDDIGYVQQSREEMEVLFTLLAERYERGSVLITSNRLCGAPHNVFNAESGFMLSPDSIRVIRSQVEGFSLRITGVAFSIAIN